jgi:type VI secretion system VasD/TssJ family lipoprotein
MFSSSSKLSSAKSASEQAKFNPPQEYKKGGITLNIAAVPQLNLFKNTPHTLLLCLYQLRDPNAFNQLADDPNSFSKLMECSKFDSSIAYVKRIVVQPGQTLTDQRDLAEGTRFIGIATGYYSNTNEKSTYLAPLGGRSATTVNIELGSNEITRVTVK